MSEKLPVHKQKGSTQANRVGSCGHGACRHIPAPVWGSGFSTSLPAPQGQRVAPRCGSGPNFPGDQGHRTLPCAHRPLVHLYREMAIRAPGPLLQCRLLSFGLLSFPLILGARPSSDTGPADSRSHPAGRPLAFCTVSLEERSQTCRDRPDGGDGSEARGERRPYRRVICVCACAACFEHRAHAWQCGEC